MFDFLSTPPSPELQWLAWFVAIVAPLAGLFFWFWRGFIADWWARRSKKSSRIRAARILKEYTEAGKLEQNPTKIICIVGLLCFFGIFGMSFLVMSLGFGTALSIPGKIVNNVARLMTNLSLVLCMIISLYNLFRASRMAAQINNVYSLSRKAVEHRAKELLAYSGMTEPEIGEFVRAHIDPAPAEAQATPQTPA